MAYSRLTCVAFTSWRTGMLLPASDGARNDGAGLRSGTDLPGAAMRLSGVGRGAVMETMSGEACEAVVKSVACRAAEVEPSIGSGSAGVVWLSEGTVRPGALGLSERVSSACAVTALVGVMVAKVDDRLIILV